MIKINTKQHVKITARSAAVAAVRRLKPGLINDELYLDLPCVCMGSHTLFQTLVMMSVRYTNKWNKSVSPS